jgi:murein DD-endopeptidase MepM/ murein hydrolase activator NlpD
MLRYLDDDTGWRLYVAAIPVVKMTWGAGKTRLAKRCAAKAGTPQYGIFGPVLESKLRAAGAFDLKANQLIQQYNAAHKPKPPPPAPLTMYFPIPEGQEGRVCQGLHETAGLNGNWAIDICTPPWTTVVAAEAGVITRLSGRSPNSDTWDSQGVFGWSIRFRTPRGYEYFVTHLGQRPSEFEVGMKVEAGDTIGRVGDQRFRPDHVHYGVTSPTNETDARRHITTVGLSPRIH